MSETFYPGQRYTSLSEPELGLGIVLQSDFKFVSIFFPASDQTRQFSKQSAPLIRAIFEKGDEILGPDDKKHIVSSVSNSQGLYTYITNVGPILESQISPRTHYQRPEDKLFCGQYSTSKLFAVGSKAMEIETHIKRSPVRGFVGPAISLIAHQLYVAKSVTDHPVPRVMLADEVGLGKTIEAGLILHALTLTGRAKKSLIIVPYALSNQWYLELRRRFHLKAMLINKVQTLEQENNIFEDSQAIITSLEFIILYEEARKLILEAQWDLLIVDEAHRIAWTKEKPSIEFALVESLAQKVPGVLLLSATPEKHGHEAHFERLKLLDPHRFTNYNQYLKDIEKFEELVKKVEHLEKVGPQDFQKEMKKIIDEQGTGRVLFRNTRGYLEKFSPVSAPRRVSSQPLSDEKAKDFWLWDFLQSYPQEKILLITSSKSTILHIERFLSGKGFHSFALFHSDLSLLDRDRFAAQFSLPEGPQILLCSEIGSEGRNFQFCQHLILFDLPADMEMIEQRIGRLDRIGQKGEVHIHIPYVQNSYQEVLFRWLNEGVDAFSSYVQGSTYIFDQAQKVLNEAATDAKLFLSDPIKMNRLIDETRKVRQSVENFLNSGMNKLLGLNSFDLEEAKKIQDEIQTQENDSTLQDFMELVYETVGVESEEVRPGIYFLTPGDNMLIPHFPGLPAEGMRVTFDRKLVLLDENIEFLSIDHPIVLGVLDMFVGQGLAAASVANWINPSSPPVLELFFELHLIAPHQFMPERFFPGHIVRKVLTLDGRDVSKNLPSEKLIEKIQEITLQGVQKLKGLPRDTVKKIIYKAKTEAQVEAQEILQQYISHTEKILGQEHKRLLELKKRGALVSEQELEFLTEQKNVLLLALQNTTPKLHSLRFVF